VTDVSASPPAVPGTAQAEPDRAGAPPVDQVADPGRSPGRRQRLPGVWQNQAFRLLWGGQTVSMLGSQVTQVAVPLLAVITLHASIAQMGVLGTVARLPFLLYIVAGVWVDRSRRRRVLIGTDLGRGVLMLSLPVAALFGVLTLPLLVVVVLAVMVLSVWFDIAYLSYVPALVEVRELTTANTVMETSNSLAMVVGNSIGGFLVEVLTAPIAILIDSLSFFASAVAVWRIRRPEPPLADTDRSGLRGVASSLAVGVRYVVHDRILAPLCLAIGLYNLFWSAELALYVFYLARDLHLGAGIIGLTLAAAAPGAAAGSALAGQAQRKLGVSTTIISALTLFAVSACLIPLAPKDHAVAIPMLMVAGFLMYAGLQLCSINVITTRQTISPRELLGRITASFRFMAFGTAPFGSMLGGLLGLTLGARDGILAAVLGLFLAPLVVALSPVRKLRRLPVPDSESGN